MKTNLAKYFLALLVCQFAVKGNSQQRSDSDIKTAGAMQRVMMMGELQGRIKLDTIRDKKHLYGLGPLEFLKGEIMIWDGTAYNSKVGLENQMVVQTGFNIKAPFFVYANVSTWKMLSVPSSVKNQRDLEDYLDKISPADSKPFAFKISTTIDSARIHVVNLPDGFKVSSPEDAHKGQKDYVIVNQPVDIVGFFSRIHQGVFTHHSSLIHLHLITTDRKLMGHLDKVVFGANRGALKVYIAE